MFIVSDAVETIQKAVETLKKVEEVGKVPWYAACVAPWKVNQMLALKGEIESYGDHITNQLASLQSAIGVASYTVQLEQLERSLDGTRVFKHKDMKELWKRKLGADKTRVLCSEFFGIHADKFSTSYFIVIIQ